MRGLTLALLGLMTAVGFAQEGELKRYLYMSHPDKSQGPANNTPGYMIFDIDNDFKFVRRVSFPVFGKHGGLRGFEPSLANKSVYYTTNIDNQKGLVGRIDLTTDKLVWEKEYAGIGDRASVSVDGKKLFVPTGWWHRALDGGNVVIDALTGAKLRFHKYGSSPHNSFVTPNGKYMFMNGAHWLAWMDTETEELVHMFGNPKLAWDTKVPINQDLGNGGVSPLSADSKLEFAYFSHRDAVGFDIIDLKNKKVAHHVNVLENGKIIPRRTHGVALTPDEKEIWISDTFGTRLIVFDNTVSPPVMKQSIPVRRNGHGWVFFTRDGKYCIPHTSDIIDVKTKKKVITLVDDKGTLVEGSKFFEAHFRGKELIWVSSQFGLGSAHSDPVTSAKPGQSLYGKYDLSSKISEAYVYGADGRVVKRVAHSISNPDQLKSGLPFGLYHLVLKSEGRVIRQKMMVIP